MTKTYVHSLTDRTELLISVSVYFQKSIFLKLFYDKDLLDTIEEYDNSNALLT